jgi:hypothetical protein
MPELDSRRTDKLDDIEWRLVAATSVLTERIRTGELEKGQRLAVVLLIDEKKTQWLSIDATRLKNMVLEYAPDGAAIGPACIYCAGKAKLVNVATQNCVCEECADASQIYDRI